MNVENGALCIACYEYRSTVVAIFMFMHLQYPRYVCNFLVIKGLSICICLRKLRRAFLSRFA